MEPTAKNAAITSIKPNSTIDQTIPPSHDHETDKLFQPQLKRNRSKNIFKVALLTMRRRSQKSKELSIEDESRGTWRKLVGSMRPLHHLQESQSPLMKNPQTLNTMKSPSETATNDDGLFDSIPNSPISPSPSSSRYASAIGLNEMVHDQESREDQKQEEEEEIANTGADAGGDEMIDAKAEEFIAEFYLQMKLQRFNVMDRHYREISRRSLGL